MKLPPWKSFTTWNTYPINIFSHQAPSTHIQSFAIQFGTLDSLSGAKRKNSWNTYTMWILTFKLLIFPVHSLKNSSLFRLHIKQSFKLNGWQTHHWIKSSGTFTVDITIHLHFINKNSAREGKKKQLNDSAYQYAFIRFARPTKYGSDVVVPGVDLGPFHCKPISTVCFCLKYTFFVLCTTFIIVYFFRCYQRSTDENNWIGIWCSNLNMDWPFFRFLAESVCYSTYFCCCCCSCKCVNDAIKL